jgi:CheY-like chemotaxis protein
MKRILVIEDQDDLRGVLRDLFSRSGYVVMEGRGRGGGRRQRQVPPP